MAGVGLHISQALKGKGGVRTKSLEFTQLIKAIGASSQRTCAQRPLNL